MGTELVHDGVDDLHITGIGLIGRIALGKDLDQLIHGGLIIAHGGRKCINRFLAGRGVGIGGGHVDQGRNTIQDDELKIKHSISIFQILEHLYLRVDCDSHTLS